MREGSRCARCPPPAPPRPGPAAAATPGRAPGAMAAAARKVRGERGASRAARGAEETRGDAPREAPDPVFLGPAGWRKLPAAGGLLSGRATEGERPGPAARPLPPPGQRSRTGRAESAGVRSGPASCAVTCGGAERSRRRRAPRRGLLASTSRGSPRCPALRSRRRGTHNDPTTGRSHRRGATCQGTSQAGPENPSHALVCPRQNASWEPLHALSSSLSERLPEAVEQFSFIWCKGEKQCSSRTPSYIEDHLFCWGLSHEDGEMRIAG